MRPVYGVYQIRGDTVDPDADRLIKVWHDAQTATEYCIRFNRQRRQHGERFYVNTIWTDENARWG